MPAAVNTSLGYTAIYGATSILKQAALRVMLLETRSRRGWHGECAWRSRERREGKGRQGYQTSCVFVKMVQCKFACLAGCPELFQSVKNDVIDGYYKKALDSHNVGEAVYRIAIDPKPKLRQCVPLCLTHLRFACRGRVGFILTTTHMSASYFYFAAFASAAICLQNIMA